MTDSIKLPVEIEYHFHWENPCFKQKIEVFACDAHVATVDKLGTLHRSLHVPCGIEVTHAARIWAGWEKATPDERLPITESRLPTAESRLPTENHQDEIKLVERYQQCVSKLLTLFPFDPLVESPAHFYIERLEALVKRKLLIPNLPLKPPSTLITREQASAIRQLIRASYFNLPGLHVHVLLEVFDSLILEANCEFDECTCERDATAHSQDCPIVRKYCLMVPGGTIFPPADWPGWARTPDARPPTTDRRLPTTETPLDSSDLRTAMHHCPECRAVGEPDDHRHKPWCSKVVGSP